MKSIKNWKVLLFSIAITANTSFSTPKVIDEIIAIVNTNAVLKSDVDNLFKLIKLNENPINQIPQDSAILRYQILEHLIMNQIILQIGQKVGIEVNDEQIDQMITKIAKKNNISISQIQSKLIDDRISYNTYRDQIRKEMIISKVRDNEVRRRIDIRPQEVDELVKQMINQNNANTELNLSYILIPLLENPTSDQISKAKNQAYSIIDEIRNSGDFNKSAVTYSAVNQKTPKSGQIGWKRLQELPSIFARALIVAKKGDIVGPIRSDSGFHILKVNDLHSQNQNVSVTEVHARHILLKTSPIMTDDQARAKLQHISSDIKNGKISFASAAKEFSQDLGSANLGGDLGWTIADAYDPDFRDTLMKLKKCQISAPVHSSFGWHLIELLNTRNVDKTDAVQKDRAYRILFNRRFSEEAIMWMQEQRANSYVKVLNN